MAGETIVRPKERTTVLCDSEKASALPTVRAGALPPSRKRTVAVRKSMGASEMC